MIILFDSAAIVHPADFGAGLLDAVPPAVKAQAKPRKPFVPSQADQLYWEAFGLGADGEDPATPTGLDSDERHAWEKGVRDGRAALLAGYYEEYATYLDRLDAELVPAIEENEARGAWGGHPAFEG